MLRRAIASFTETSGAGGILHLVSDMFDGPENLQVFYLGNWAPISVSNICEAFFDLV